MIGKSKHCAGLLVVGVVVLCIAAPVSPASGQDARPSEGEPLGVANPAAVYCRELGYDVEIVKTEDGERCMCFLPNGERCDAWDFYRGKCWPEYSYCARQGYRMETRVEKHGAYVTECAVCVSEDGTVLGTVAELMGLEKKVITGVGVPMPTDEGRRRRAPERKSRDLPAAFTWCDHGGCSSVKDQASCGSCWAFATVGPLECNIMIKDSVEVDISEQWLVSCNQDYWSCSGGWWAHDYHQWKTDPCGGTGAVLEEDFPYEALNLPCDCPYPHEYLLLGWDFVTTDDELPPVDLIKQAIYDYGPITAGVYVTWDFHRYSYGIFDEHASGQINHGVTLVGWDDNQGTEGIWILKNSWGTDWGEGGYMRIEYGSNSIAFACCYVDYLCMRKALVKADGTGDYPTIQAAMDSLPVECAGVIELEDGTYTGPGNRDLQIENRRMIIRSLSGDPDLCTIDCEGLGRMAMVQASGERTSLTLEGLTVTGGSVSGTSRGGAVMCGGALLNLRECVITGNQAEADGGAICCDSSSLSINVCTIEDNTSAGAGGAIWSGEGSTVGIDGSTLSGNRAGVRGGAVATSATDAVVISACTISGNRTDSTSVDGRGGALFCESLSALEGSVIAGNWSAGAGGGIFLSPDAGSATSMDECTITANWAVGTGGGISCEGDFTLSLSRVIVWDNGAGGAGEEVYLGAGNPSFEAACSDVDSTGVAGSGTVVWLWHNIFAIPGFCGARECTDAPTSAGDYHLKEPSPCAEGNAPAVCHTIGALGVGCPAAIVTVCADGSGDYPTIQTAVDSTPHYDIIELCDGTYTGDGNRDVDFRGKVLTVRSESGTPHGCVIDCGGLGRGFYLHSGEDFRAVIQDLTVANGHAARGGAILCEGASPTISGCVLHHSSADECGGAVCCENASPSVTGCTLADNSAPAGGGIGCLASSPEIDRTIVAASVSGEAVFCDGTSGPVLSCCDLYGNAGGDWVGAIASQYGADGNFSADPCFCDPPGHDYFLYSSSPCRDASGCGQVGALGVGCYRGWVWRVPQDVPTIQAGLDSAVAGDTVLVSCGTYFEYDMSMTSGAILRSETGSAACVTIDAGGQGRILTCYGMDSTTAIVGLTFTGGSAHALMWPGNAGGAIYCEDSSPQVSGCLFDGNSAEYGGAVTSRAHAPRIRDCTFVNNSASGCGGGIYSYYSDLTLENTIVAFSAEGNAVDGYQGSAGIACCDFYGNAGGDWVSWVAGKDTTGGNFCEDPGFCEPFTGHVVTYSPCAPGNSPPGCGLVGALGVGCELTEISEVERSLPARFALGPAVPNPFNPVTAISYAIPPGGGPDRVTLTVYNCLGQRVKTLVDTGQPAGFYSVAWDGTDEKYLAVASGVYFYRLAWNGKAETKRMVLLK